MRAGGLRQELKWHCDWFVALVLAFRHGLCYIPEFLQYVSLVASSCSQNGIKQFSEQQEVVRNILNLLLSPQYDDVMDYFKIPSVLSRFGFKLLRLLVSDSRYSIFLSRGLISGAIRVGENCQADFVSLTRLKKEDLLAGCQDVLRECSNYFKNQGKKKMDEGKPNEAALNFQKANEADYTLENEVTVART